MAPRLAGDDMQTQRGVNKKKKTEKRDRERMPRAGIEPKVRDPNIFPNAVGDPANTFIQGALL